MLGACDLQSRPRNMLVADIANMPAIIKGLHKAYAVAELAVPYSRPFTVTCFFWHGAWYSLYPTCSVEWASFRKQSTSTS